MANLQVATDFEKIINAGMLWIVPSYPYILVLTISLKIATGRRTRLLPPESLTGTAERAGDPPRQGWEVLWQAESA